MEIRYISWCTMMASLTSIFTHKVLLTSTELYKFIAIDTIKDDTFLNIVGAAG